MENNAYNEQIDAYLDGDLSPKENKAFETALTLDADLQEAVRWHRLTNKALAETAQDAYIRSVADNVRLKVGKLPEPKTETGFFQRLLDWVKTPFGIIIGLGFVAVLGYAHTLKSTSELVNAYAFKPADSRVAGASTVSDEAFLRELAGIYFNETPQVALDKLNLLRGGKTDILGLVLLDYYTAHADLKAEQYTAAQMLFESVLTQQDYLKTFSVTSDIGKLRFNLILAQLALNHKGNEAISALETLSKAAETKGEVKERCQNLSAELSHPLRRFKVF